MFVVVVGSREWRGKEAEEQVNLVLDDIHMRYASGDLVLVSSSSDKGVGLIIKDRCLKDKEKFQFVDFHIRCFARLSRPKLQQVFEARDRALLQIGEEYHVFVDSNRHGAFEEFIERVENEGRNPAVHVGVLNIHKPKFAEVLR